MIKKRKINFRAFFNLTRYLAKIIVEHQLNFLIFNNAKAKLQSSQKESLQFLVGLSIKSYKWMRGRQYIAVALSYLLALFIRLYQLLTWIIFKVGSFLETQTATNARIVRSWTNLSSEDGRFSCQCIHVVANSSLSLMLAFGVLHYHQHFVELIVLVSHHVHHWFIQLITDVPDFSWFLRSYTVKLILCYLYLVFGYTGLSAQITLTIDLINFCNLPTIAVYKLLAKIYQLLLKYFLIFAELLSKQEDHWLSCPYPKWMLRHSWKTVYIACLPVMISAMALVGFYYIWLTLVIVVLKIAINLALNAVIMMDQLGFFICIVKGLNIEPENKNKYSKLDAISIRMKQTQWVNLVEPSMFLQIIKGRDLLASEESTLQLGKARSIKQIFNQLRSLIS